MVPDKVLSSYDFVERDENDSGHKHAEWKVTPELAGEDEEKASLRNKCKERDHTTQERRRWGQIERVEVSRKVVARVSSSEMVKHCII